MRKFTFLFCLADLYEILYLAEVGLGKSSEEYRRSAGDRILRNIRSVRSEARRKERRI